MTHSRYLIGYGTLLLRASLDSTIGRSMASTKRMRPVVVSGYIRTFSLRPDHYVPSSKLLGQGQESGAMNVAPSATKSFNGLAFAITPEELEALDERERFYERRSVPMHDFETGEALGEGYVYVGQDPWLSHDPRVLMPLWRDVVWGRTGAYAVSANFGAYFDKTTYLADGNTLVVDVYRELLADVSDVAFPSASQ